VNDGAALKAAFAEAFNGYTDYLPATVAAELVCIARCFMTNRGRGLK
jgi:hypothetical protein